MGNALIGGEDSCLFGWGQHHVDDDHGPPACFSCFATHSDERWSPTLDTSTR